MESAQPMRSCGAEEMEGVSVRPPGAGPSAPLMWIYEELTHGVGPDPTAAIEHDLRKLVVPWRWKKPPTRTALFAPPALYPPS